jgi:hypothetical protein
MSITHRHAEPDSLLSASRCQSVAAGLTTLRCPGDIDRIILLDEPHAPQFPLFGLCNGHGDELRQVARDTDVAVLSDELALAVAS